MQWTFSCGLILLLTQVSGEICASDKVGEGTQMDDLKILSSDVISDIYILVKVIICEYGGSEKRHEDISH